MTTTISTLMGIEREPVSTMALAGESLAHRQKLQNVVAEIAITNYQLKEPKIGSLMARIAIAQEVA